MSKILLINPPCTRQKLTADEKYIDELKREAFATWMGVTAHKYGENSVYCNILPTDKISISLGILSLSSYLKKRGIDVSYIHCDYYLNEKQYNWYELIDLIVLEANSVNVCGFYSTTNNIYQVLEIAQKVKQKHPYITNVIGGPHASFCDSQLLNQYSFIDYIVRGEGEKTLYEIVKTTISPDKSDIEISGAAYCKNDIFYRMPNRPFLDSTEIPPMDFDILPKDYNFNLLTMYSRGCPFSCNFCVESGFWGNKVRFRDPNIVAKELKIISEKYGQNIIHIADSEIDTFPTKFDSLLNALKFQNINCQFSVNIRPDAFKRMDIDRLLRMKHLGFSVFFIGVESASDRVLQAMNRRTTFSDFLKTLELINGCKEDFVVIPYVMIGFPGETVSTMQKTLDAFISLLEEDRIEYMFPKIFVPYPGTDVFNNPEKYNVSISSDWDLYSRYSFVPPFEDPNLSHELRKEYLSQFYLRIIQTLNSKL